LTSSIPKTKVDCLTINHNVSRVVIEHSWYVSIIYNHHQLDITVVAELSIIDIQNDGHYQNLMINILMNRSIGYHYIRQRKEQIFSIEIFNNYLLLREVILSIYIEKACLTDSTVADNDTFDMLDGSLAHFLWRFYLLSNRCCVDWMLTIFLLMSDVWCLEPNQRVNKEEWQRLNREHSFWFCFPKCQTTCSDSEKVNRWRSMTFLFTLRNNIIAKVPLSSICRIIQSGLMGTLVFPCNLWMV